MPAKYCTILATTYSQDKGKGKGGRAMASASNSSNLYILFFSVSLLQYVW